MNRLLRGEGRIGGVCEGFGNYFGVDPVLFRLLFIVMFFTPFPPATFIYLICWVVMKKL